MASRDVFTKEYLEEHYIRQGKTLKQIAQENGYVAGHSVREALDYHGFPRVNQKPSVILTKELLYQLYVIEQKSDRIIAAELGLRSRTSVRNAIKDFGFPARKKGWMSPARIAWGKSRRTGYGEISGSYWCSIRNCAEQRGLELQVTIQEAWEQFLLQNRLCALSGVELIFAPRAEVLKNRDAQTASLDRIDSNLGYIAGNIQWIHKELQWMKSDLPDERFRDWCNKVANYSQHVRLKEN